MGFITEWLTNIILFILLATIVELLLPNSSMQRYVKMVVGLLLFLLILNPLLSIFTKDPTEWLSTMKIDEYTNENILENSIENKKIEIENGQRAYISEQVAVQMKRQVEYELFQNFSLQVTGIEISLDEQLARLTNESEIIEHVWLTVDDVTEGRENEQVQIEKVQLVSINTTDPIPEKVETTSTKNEVQDFLAEAWKISKDNISLVWEGGREDE